MKKLPQVSEIAQVRLGRDAYFDAWLYNMMIDNNIAYQMNPDLIATPEQIRFMVWLEPDQVYIPCSDDIFVLLNQSVCPPALLAQYNRAWRIIMRLVRSVEQDRKTRQRILEFCRYRFSQYIRHHTVIPSRVVKRMTNLVFAQTGDADPWEVRRQEAHRRAQALLDSGDVRRAINATPRQGLHGDISAIRAQLDNMELARLMYLSIMARPWLSAAPSPLTMEEDFAKVQSLAEPLHTLLGGGEESSKTILFLCDADGGLPLDLAMLFRLMRMGHKVILAVKSGFFFYAPQLRDMDADPVLKRLVEQFCVVHDPAISKNDLLRLLREHRLVIIGDGTRERLNLHRTSVTFARAWKEADLVLAKGWRNAEVLINTTQLFTRDILCYWLQRDGSYCVKAKPRARGVRKFSETALVERADNLIAGMREARRAGKSVMFYSCVIGSIPGQLQTAIQVVNAFVNNLRQKLEQTYIVNPTEHAEEGMDGDDLMFMWERVQRSGYIEVWRFQTVQDIEESFTLLGRKVPPVWTGKDATYSTGCTKEMRIALDVQRRNREMQIIGPDPEKFFRRDEYGVGKYFDARISE